MRAAGAGRPTECQSLSAGETLCSLSLWGCTSACQKSGGIRSPVCEAELSVERNVCCAGNNFCGSVPGSLSVWDCTSVCQKPNGSWPACSANGTALPLPPKPPTPTIAQATCESLLYLSHLYHPRPTLLRAALRLMGDTNARSG